jgi:hypothetical protein
MIYDDLVLVFYDVIFIFVIIVQAKSLSLDTYDEDRHFIIEDISFCDESKQRHEQIVTNDHFSSSVTVCGYTPPEVPLSAPSLFGIGSSQAEFEGTFS